MRWNSLISEDKGKSVSLGRVSFWLAFFISLPFWILGWWYTVPVYPDSLRFFLVSSLGYNLGKHFANAWQNTKTTNQDQNIPSSPSKNKYSDVQEK